MKYTNHLQKPTRPASFMVAVIVSVISMLPFKASADVPEGDPLFTVTTGITDWNENKVPSTIMESNNTPGDTRWLTYGFTHGYNNNKRAGLWCGINNTRYTAYLHNQKSIEASIGTVSATISNIGEDRFFISTTLLVSDDSEFANAETISAEKGRNNIWIFQIDNPRPNLYYKICVESYVQNSTSLVYCINLSEVNFYAPQELAAPEMDENMNSNREFTLMSNSGELHLIASEYDKNGNFIQDVEAPSATVSSIMKSVTDDSDVSWRHKVADQGEPYTIAPPKDKDHFTIVRAKSVSGDEQSPELYKFIHDSGIITGVESIFDDSSDASEQWYNLQGAPVENPANGVFIRVSGGKAAKVRL